MVEKAHLLSDQFTPQAGSSRLLGGPIVLLQHIVFYLYTDLWKNFLDKTGGDDYHGGV
jgi:hypothetical protein